MTFYLDVGVVRIQEYILRTAGADEGQLRKRRGASQMISEATDTGFLAPFGFELNDETYDTEGVAHLKAANGTGDAETVKSCLAMLRKKLPQAHLSASWAEADSYAEAHRKISNAKGGKPAADGVGLLEWVPPVREVVSGKACAGCGRLPARSGGNCSDCAKRDVAGRKFSNPVKPISSERSADAPVAPEIKTMERLADRTGLTLKAVEDLNELAALNPFRGKKKNQLATIYADANNVGSTFDQVERVEDRKKLSDVLTGAIAAGVDKALYLLRKQLAVHDKGAFPASVTVLAADDVVITVPASLGWLFVETLIATFETRIDEASPGDKRPPLSLSAAIVFSHSKQPIEHTINLAADVLKTAKAETRGKASSIGWHDLTQHGIHGKGRARSQQWFGRRRGVIEELSGWPAHQRNKWMRDLAAKDVDADQLMDYLKDEAERLDMSQTVKDLLKQLPPKQAPAELADLFEISRWWAMGAEQGEQQ